MRVYYATVYTSLKTPRAVCDSLEAAKAIVEAGCEEGGTWDSEHRLVAPEGHRLEWLGAVFEFELVADRADPLRDLAFKILEGDPMATDAAKDVMRC